MYFSIWDSSTYFFLYGFFYLLTFRCKLAIKDHSFLFLLQTHYFRQLMLIVIMINTSQVMFILYTNLTQNDYVRLCLIFTQFRKKKSTNLEYAILKNLLPIGLDIQCMLALDLVI